MQLRAVMRNPVVVPVVSLIIAAWLSLFSMEQSSDGQLMSHAAGHMPSIGGVSGQVSGLLNLGPFTAGWALMVVAMMLPVVLPTATHFSRSIEQKGARAELVLLLLGAYVLVWTAFGVIGHLALQVSFQAPGRGSISDGLTVSGAVILAGAYQFTPLKRRAIHRSYSLPAFAPPPGEPFKRWVSALVLGLYEGIVCIRCCWALMLLMLVGVAGSSGWMLVLGLAMYFERNAPWGRRLVMPLGLFLIGLGLTFGWGSLMGILPWHNHPM